MTDGLKPIDAASAVELRAALDRLGPLIRRYSAIVHASPLAGSRAHADGLLPHSRWIGLHAQRAISVAIDHLEAWQLLVRGKTLPRFSPMTLLRGGLEGAARRGPSRRTEFDSARSHRTTQLWRA
jgi:hypothetical protein